MKIEHKESWQFRPDWMLELRQSGTVEFAPNEPPPPVGSLPIKPVPTGYRRESSSYIVDVYGRKLTYLVIDVEQDLNPPPPEADVPFIVGT